MLDRINPQFYFQVPSIAKKMVEYLASWITAPPRHLVIVTGFFDELREKVPDEN